MRSKLGRSWCLVISGLVALGWLVGCEKPPQEELEAARAVIDTALAAKAHLYAAKEYEEAGKLLDRAEDEVAAKDYEAARLSALEAKAKAEEAKKVAKVNMEKAKQDAEAALAEAKAARDAAQAANTAPELAKVDPGEHLTVEELLREAENQLAQAESLIQIGNYIQAQEAANTAKATAIDTKEQAEVLVEAVAQKAAAKKSKRRRR